MKIAFSKVLRRLGWCGASCFVVLGLAGCSGGEDAAAKESNLKAAAQPTPVAGVAPLSSRPPGVPADRPRFPGEPKR